ncbi:MAG TPA: hypothetical protein VFO14_20075 [Vicinamibacterales bacterium]|nr:hypothetical protein [Vicinamibacterales bacterium]
MFPPEDLVRLLEAGADISRSTWDLDSLLVHLDIDYQNVDKPAAPFAHPGDVFLKLEPVRAAVQAIFDELGLPMLVIMTGRGYHFTSRIPLASPLVTKLAGLAPLPSWFSTCSTRRPAWTRQIITEEHARAYNGMGLLIEHVAHLGLQRSAARSRIPVVLNGTVVGPDVYGRECTSLDLSYAGDPLDIRHLRVAFGAYQTHRLRDDITAHPAICTLPPLVAVPLGAGPSWRCSIGGASPGQPPSSPRERRRKSRLQPPGSGSCSSRTSGPPWCGFIATSTRRARTSRSAGRKPTIVSISRP